MLETLLCSRDTILHTSADEQRSFAPVEDALDATSQEEVIYTVQAGDTWSEIAARYDMSSSELLALNPGFDIDKIWLDQELTVSAAVPQAEPSCGHEMEERIIRLEEALSRLNERVVALEQRADGAAEQDLNVSAISGDIQSLLTEGNALCGQLKSLAAELGSTPSGVSAESPEAAPLPGSSAEVAEEPPFPPVPSRSAEIPWESSSPEADPDDGPDVLGLALESLERRLALLESRPVQAPDAAGIVQDVLALVRVDMEKASEEQEASARALEQLERRVQELESRPLPQLILPDLPDTEAITADVMSRIQNELDRIAAEAAARVLREEIAGLMGK